MTSPTRTSDPLILPPIPPPPDSLAKIAEGYKSADQADSSAKIAETSQQSQSQIQMGKVIKVRDIYCLETRSQRAERMERAKETKEIILRAFGPNFPYAWAKNEVPFVEIKNCLHPDFPITRVVMGDASICYPDIVKKIIQNKEVVINKEIHVLMDWEGQDILDCDYSASMTLADMLWTEPLILGGKGQVLVRLHAHRNFDFYVNCLWTTADLINHIKTLIPSISFDEDRELFAKIDGEEEEHAFALTYGCNYDQKLQSYGIFQRSQVPEPYCHIRMKVDQEMKIWTCEPDNGQQALTLKHLGLLDPSSEECTMGCCPPMEVTLWIHGKEWGFPLAIGPWQTIHTVKALIFYLSARYYSEPLVDHPYIQEGKYDLVYMGKPLKDSPDILPSCYLSKSEEFMDKTISYIYTKMLPNKGKLRVGDYGICNRDTIFLFDRALFDIVIIHLKDDGSEQQRFVVSAKMGDTVKKIMTKTKQHICTCYNWQVNQKAISLSYNGELLEPDVCLADYGIVKPKDGDNKPKQPEITATMMTPTRKRKRRTTNLSGRPSSKAPDIHMKTLTRKSAGMSTRSTQRGYSSSPSSSKVPNIPVRIIPYQENPIEKAERMKKEYEESIKFQSMIAETANPQFVEIKNYTHPDFPITRLDLKDMFAKVEDISTRFEDIRERLVQSYSTREYIHISKENHVLLDCRFENVLDTDEYSGMTLEELLWTEPLMLGGKGEILIRVLAPNRKYDLKGDCSWTVQNLKDHIKDLIPSVSLIERELLVGIDGNEQPIVPCSSQTKLYSYGIFKRSQEEPYIHIRLQSQSGHFAEVTPDNGQEELTLRHLGHLDSYKYHRRPEMQVTLWIQGKEWGFPLAIRRRQTIYTLKALIFYLSACYYSGPLADHAYILEGEYDLVFAGKLLEDSPDILPLCYYSEKGEFTKRTITDIYTNLPRDGGSITIAECGICSYDRILLCDRTKFMISISADITAFLPIGRYGSTRLQIPVKMGDTVYRLVTLFQQEMSINLSFEVNQFKVNLSYNGEVLEPDVCLVDYGIVKPRDGDKTPELVAIVTN